MYLLGVDSLLYPTSCCPLEGSGIAIVEVPNELHRGNCGLIGPALSIGSFPILDLLSVSITTLTMLFSRIILLPIVARNYGRQGFFSLEMDWALICLFLIFGPLWFYSLQAIKFVPFLKKEKKQRAKRIKYLVVISIFYSLI